MRIKKWKLPEFPREAADTLENTLGLPKYISEILAARGFTAAQAQEFLQEASLFLNPYQMQDMQAAVQRIAQAVENGEKIAVYGDYDCDGITATALLYTYFQDIGAVAMYYIPDRETEGYGLNCPAIDALAGRGVDLIVTVDNGISSIKEVAYANSLGIDVVVTDHHQPREQLPPAAAVVDPHRKDCPYPFKSLCGAGVAFKLICAMEGDLTCREILDHYAHIIALGTVGDVVELTGENRAIVKAGLISIANGENLGLSQLMRVSGIAESKLDSRSLSFGLVPRINAAGRMGKATLALELLMADDEETALALAQKLDQLNEERKALVNHILEDVEQMLAREPSLLEQRVILLAKEGWHHGIVGIAAAKIVEQYSKPCILFAIDGEEARGSARSVEGYSIIEAINRCQGLLTRYGGHHQAAGLSLWAKDLPGFIQEFLQDAGQHFDIMPVDQLIIDAVLPQGAASVSIVKELGCLEPFGAGNETPVFLLPQCRIESIIPLSNDKHLRLRLWQNGQIFYALYFGVSSRQFPYGAGETVDIAANLELNEYNGEVSVSIKIKGVHPGSLPQDKLIIGRQYYEKLRRREPLTEKITQYITPNREDIAQIYRYLKQCRGFGWGYDLLWCRLGKINFCKMMLCLDIMEEMGLLQPRWGTGEALVLAGTAAKVNLEDSSILQCLKGGETVCIPLNC